jgi:hypothetical protein
MIRDRSGRYPASARRLASGTLWGLSPAVGQPAPSAPPVPPFGPFGLEPPKGAIAAMTQPPPEPTRRPGDLLREKAALAVPVRKKMPRSAVNAAIDRVLLELAQRV